MNNRKRLDPRNVDLAAQTRNDFTFLKSLQAISNYRDVSFPVTADGLDAIEFIKYINCVLPVLARALWEYDSPNGPLNPKASHRTSSHIGGHPDDVCMKKLMVLRDDMRTYLFQNFYSLAQPPPLSGGDTAKWSIALHMWIFILHVTCLQFRYAKKTIKVRSQSKEEIVTEYEKYIPGDNDYLTSNNLVTEATVPLCVYSVRTLQTTLMNFIERICTIAEYSDDLDTFYDHLLQRTAEVVIGSGSASVYDAPEWCSSVATAHSNVDDHVANNCNNKLVCTSEFETQTMVWFYTLNLYFVHYYQMAAPPDSQALTKRLDDIYNAADTPRVGLAEAKKLCWYPRSELRYYVMEFLCLYASDCKDDTYQNGMRDYQSQFQFSPEQAVLYRLQQGTVNAKPADVLIAPVPNKSSVSMEYVRVYKWSIPLLECLHRFWNWRYGETRVRSSYMNGNAFNMQLAVLYVINLYFAAHTKIWFKNRFVMYQR